MEDELKPSKKKRSKKEVGEEHTARFEDLAALTSSDVIRQVKAGMSRIAPLEPQSEDSLIPDDPSNSSY